MSFLDSTVALQKLVQDNWTASAIKFENIPFNPVKNATGNPQPYIAFIIRETELAGGSEITLGSDNPWYRWGGVALTQVFIPENNPNRGLATQYIDQLKGLFKRRITIAYATDISVVALDNSLNSITTDFLTNGIIVGSLLTMSGFTNSENNGIFQVLTVTQRKITFDPLLYTLVDEVAGQNIFMTGVKTISYRNSGFIRLHMGFPSVIGINNGWWQENYTVRYFRDSQS